MTTKFERDKVYKTRDGREARVICVDAPGEMSLITLVDTHAEWKLCRVYSNGRFSKYADDPLDLMLPKPEPIVEWGTIWVERLQDFSRNVDEASARDWAFRSGGSRLLAKRTTEIVEE